jgi:hypothetical protein
MTINLSFAGKRIDGEKVSGNFRDWYVTVGATVREGFSSNESGLYLKEKPALTLGLLTR